MRLPPLLGGGRLVLFVRLVVNGIGQATAGVATVLIARLVFDHLFTEPAPFSSGGLFWLVGGLILAAAAIALLGVLQRLDAERLGQEYVARLRLRLFDRLSTLPPRTLQQSSHGALMLRFVNDLTAIKTWISRGLARLIVAGIASSGALAALTVMNLALGLVAISFVAATFGLTMPLGGPLRARAREARRRRAQIAANVGEKLTSFAVVQVFDQTNRERGHLARQGRRLVEASVANARLSALAVVLPQAAVGIAIGVVIIVGALELGAGRATAGTLVASLAILGFLASPVRDLGQTFVYWNNYKVARRKIEEFLRNPSYLEDSDRAVDIQIRRGCLTFERVSVDKGLVEVTATAEPGSLVLVTGPNGAGKSTILTLAARLLDPDQGRVLLDGHDLRSLKLSSIRRAVGMVSPDLPLLRGTIMRNILYRWPQAPSEEVSRVFALCGLEEALAGLPDGRLARVSEGGTNLPTGLRQRVSLARALLGSPTLLLFDEPDANLDPLGRSVLDALLSQSTATILLVSHDFARVKLADAAWYLESGRLVQQGTPEELLGCDGPFKLFWGLEPKN